MSKRAGLVLLAALLTAVLTARLGFWQLDRAATKRAAQTALDDQRKRPALRQADLARDQAAATTQQNRRVELQGQWLAQDTVYLENRPMDGRTGFFAVTPLMLDDGTAVLVQRGWLPRDLLDRTLISAQPPPAGLVQVAGRLALSPSRLFEFEPAASGAIRQNLDTASFAQEKRLRLRPLTVVQEDTAGAKPDGLKRHWAAPALGLDKHYGYAVQWFALSALSVGLYVWFQLLSPRRRATRLQQKTDSES